jgi:hypothetical protein
MIGWSRPEAWKERVMTEGVGTGSATVADLLEQVGSAFESGELEWGQGAARIWRGRDPMGKVQWAFCIIGGLNQMNYVYDHCVSVWNAVTAVSKHLELADQQSVPGWNDMPGRTVAEVVDALKGTAKDIRNQLEPGDG